MSKKINKFEEWKTNSHSRTRWSNVPLEVLQPLKDMFNDYFKSFDLNASEKLQFEFGLDGLCRDLIYNMPMKSIFQTDIEWAIVAIRLFVSTAAEASHMSESKLTQIMEGVNMMAHKALEYVLKAKGKTLTKKSQAGKTRLTDKSFHHINNATEFFESYESFKKFLTDISNDKSTQSEDSCVLGGLDKDGKGQFFNLGDHVKLYALKMIPYDYKPGDLIDEDALIATIFADTVRFRLSNGEVVELGKDDVRAEKITLKSDFSKIMLNGLTDKKDGYRYATYNAFKIALQETCPELVDEFKYRLSDNENPVKVVADIYKKCAHKSEELDRLALKISHW